MPQADEPGLRRACETLPNPTEPHGTPERRSLAARRAPRRAAPRRAPPHVYVGGARPGRPAPTQQPPTRHSARVPPAEDRRLEASALATVRGLFVRGSVAAARAALVPGGEARTTASDREARRGARRAESPSDDRVRRCGAPSSTEQRSRRGDRTVRGARAARGRRADEPAAREEERGRGVRKQGAEARRCGVLEPRAEAPGRESTRRLS